MWNFWHQPQTDQRLFWTTRLQPLIGMQGGGHKENTQSPPMLQQLRPLHYKCINQSSDAVLKGKSELTNVFVATFLKSHLCSKRLWTWGHFKVFLFLFFMKCKWATRLMRRNVPDLRHCMTLIWFGELWLVSLSLEERRNLVFWDLFVAYFDLCQSISQSSKSKEIFLL